MADAPEGLWLSITELACARGIARQSAAERVDRLERLGAISTRPGKGRTKLVNVAEFDRASAGTVDGVRSLNGGGTLGPASPPTAIASSDPVLVKEQARRAAYDADLKRLDLLERLNLVVPIDNLEETVAEVAAVLLRAFDHLPSKLDTMMMACAAGPAAGRRFLKDLGIELRTVTAANLQELAGLAGNRPRRDVNDVEIPQDSGLQSAE